MTRLDAFIVGAALALVGCGPRPAVSDGETEIPTSTGETTTGDGDPGDGDGDPGDGDGDGEPEPEPPSVLFIGNSYTFANDLPGLVASMAAASPNLLTTDSLAVAGARVVDHLANPELGPLLEQGFDVVVIQGQSFEPILDYPTFEQAVIDLVALTGDARVLLFMTWPRKDGNQDLIDLGMSVDEMWAGLESGYFEASLASGSEIAPVGGAWMSALQLDPPIELYAPDGSHPSVAGTYLAGCVMYGKIFETACSTSSFAPPGLAGDDIDRLQVMADIANGIVNPSP